MLPQFLKRAVILCFERRYSKQNSVFCLKSSISAPPNFFYLSQIFGLATLLVPYNTMIYYSKLKSNYFHHSWETWHHLTSSQLPSGLSAWPMFKWRGCRMRIGNHNKTSGWNTLIFRPWSTNLLVSVGQTTSQRINYFYVNEAISMSEHRAPTY